MTPTEIWRKYDAMEARLTASLSERMLELAGIRAGQRVLDLATGRGEPAIRAAHRVGKTGFVLGVDPSAEMLALARERADAESLENLELQTMDAAAFENSGRPFDAVLARWGLMYMSDPRSALRGAKKSLAPGGKLVAAVWAEPERVPYFSLPRRLLEKYRPIPVIDSSAPGVFHYADPESLNRDLRDAGFRVEQAEERDLPVMEATTTEDALAWIRALGLSNLVQDLPERMQGAWESDVRRALEAFRSDGVIRLGGVTRLVVAS